MLHAILECNDLLETHHVGVYEVFTDLEFRDNLHDSYIETRATFSIWRTNIPSSQREKRKLTQKMLMI